MSVIQSLFYSAVLWATRFELAVAMNAPARNHALIAALQRDVDEYERMLIQLELNV